MRWGGEGRGMGVGMGRKIAREGRVAVGKPGLGMVSCMVFGIWCEEVVGGGVRDRGFCGIRCSG